MHDDELDAISQGRRELLQALAVGGGWVVSRVILPAAWTAPLVASMPLPAHAALSNEVSEPRQGSGTLTAGSGPNGAAITGTRANGQVTLTITPPLALLSGRTQYEVVEELNDSGSEGMVFVRIVGRLVPSQDAALSGSATLVFPSHIASRHTYQLRWAGGHTAWNTVTQ